MDHIIDENHLSMAIMKKLKWKHPQVSPPRGYVLFFNNRGFNQQYCSFRGGAKKNYYLLSRMYVKYGYATCLAEDFTEREIMETLKMFPKLINLKGTNCIFYHFSSHGGTELGKEFYCAFDKNLFEKTILKAIKKSNDREFLKIPKVVFMTRCRNGSKPYQPPVRKSIFMRIGNFFYKALKKLQTYVRGFRYHYGGILLFHSCEKYHSSYRNPVHGTPLARFLVQTIKESSGPINIEVLCEVVKTRTTKHYEKYGKRQIPQIKNKLQVSVIL